MWDMAKKTNMAAVLDKNLPFFPSPLPLQIGSQEHSVLMNANPYHCAAVADNLQKFAVNAIVVVRKTADTNPSKIAQIVGPESEEAAELGIWNITPCTMLMSNFSM